MILVLINGILICPISREYRRNDSRITLEVLQGER